MSKSSFLGGTNTAKRKIMIREYLEEQRKKCKPKSSPFASSDENDVQEILKVAPVHINLSKVYIADSDDEQDNEEDSILSKNVNLREADLFIASLKMPSNRLKKKEINPQVYTPVQITSDDLSLYRKQTARLQKLELREAIGEEEEEDFSEEDNIQNDEA